MNAQRAVAGAARRMLTQNVMACTHRLVRDLQGGAPPASIRATMRRRQRLLAQLARDVNTPGEVGSLTALQSAVTESDRALECLIG